MRSLREGLVVSCSNSSVISFGMLKFYGRCGLGMRDAGQVQAVSPTCRRLSVLSLISTHARMQEIISQGKEQGKKKEKKRRKEIVRI